MAFKLIEPPPLQPQMPMRSGSMYGRLRKTSFTAAAWSFGASTPIW